MGCRSSKAEQSTHVKTDSLLDDGAYINKCHPYYHEDGRGAAAGSPAYSHELSPESRRAGPPPSFAHGLIEMKHHNNTGGTRPPCSPNSQHAATDDTTP
eukprot:2626365-Pyramimonas_sp.AAC.1